MKETIQESTELLPPEGDPNVGYKMFGYLKEIIEWKEQRDLITKWNRFAELSRNKHWKKKSGKPGLVSANLIFTHRQRTKNMLTDNNPTFNVSRMGGADEQDEDYTTKILRLSEFWWNDQEQQHVLEKSVLDGEEMGACVEKGVFNESIGALGDVEIQNISLFNFGLYPVKVTEPEKAEGAFHYYAMSLREVKRTWPEKASEISADEDILKEIGDNRREISESSSGKGSGYLSTFSSVVKNMINLAGGSTDDAAEVLVVEAWVFDHTMVDTGEVETDTDGKQYAVYAPKYTGKIRRVRACNAGRIVLDDMDNPSINPTLPKDKIVNCYLYNRLPFSVAQSVTDTVSWTGMSDYEQLEQLNIEVDKTISQLTIMKDKAARCKIINPKNSGVPNEHFTNRPGVLNPVNEMVAQAIGYMKGPDIPAELLTVLDVYKELFFTIAGTWDLEQANTGGKDVIAYKALAVLIERAATMMKGKIRNYSKLIRERGRMFVSLAQNWYTEERWISYKENGEENSVPIKGEDILYPAKISVVSGSTMPRARIQEREEAIALFKMGAVPLSYLYKKLDVDDINGMLKEMQAGPLGEFIEKMQAIGTPAPLIDLMGQLAQMDSKKFKQAMKEGKIPNFMQIIQALVTGQQPPDPEMIEKQIDAAKAQADIELSRAKAQTEKVKQITMVAGMHFDEESVKQNWAKLEAMIDNDKFDMILKGIQTGMNAGQYGEKGIKSNNQRLTQ